MKKIFTFLALLVLSMHLTYGQETSRPFITTWTIPADLTHTLTMTAGFAYDFSYVWKNEDGSAVVFPSTDYVSDGTVEKTLTTTFTTAGTYTLEITGTFPHFNRTSFTNIKKLADVKQWGDIAWQSMRESFHNFQGSAFTATDAPDLSNVTDMSYMFHYSSFNQDINDWEVGNVENMSYMFADSPFNQDISGWNVENVTDMSSMFSDDDATGIVAFNQDIGIWNVSNVKNMGAMFYSSPFNQDIGGWNVEKVTNMITMFLGSSFNQDISGWDVGSVESMSGMFGNTPFNQDISGWDVSKVTDMGKMFSFSSFNQDLSGWDVRNVTHMEGMFQSSPFNQDLSNWNVSAIENTGTFSSGMKDMFKNSQLSSQNYDKTLIGWASLPNLQSGIVLGAPNITYCSGEAARNILTNTFNWVITDGGKNNNCTSNTDILSFTLAAQTGAAIIDYIAHTVSIEVNNTAAITSLPLNLTLSSGATSNPANGGLVDFTNPVSITVTAEDNTTTQVWSIITTVQKPFITTWTIPADLTHSLTMTAGFDYDFSYVWKDAANAVVFSGTHTNAAGAFSTTFNTAGTYTLEITGSFPHFNRTSSTNIQKLADVNQWGDIAWQSMNSSFSHWPGSAFTATDAPDLSNVTDMSEMFFNSSFNQDISIWDVSNVKNMSYMFADSPFNQNIGDWDVSEVTDMSLMFSFSAFNQDINDWTVSHVTNMSDMFADSAFNQDISGWNVSKVTDMAFMFADSPFNQDIGGWDVEMVIDMAGMFARSAFNQDISAWKVDKVTDMNFMFTDSPFNQDLSGWNVEEVTDMSFMFYGSAFNQDIGGWNVEKVTNMKSMFEDSTFNQDIGGWIVSKVTNMRSMFGGSTFNQNIGDWNVEMVTDMSAMFLGSSFNQDIGLWNVGKVTDMSFMFADSAFNQNISTWIVSEVTTMRRMFNNSLFDQDISAWNVIKVTNMESMFGDGVLSGQNYDKMLLAWSGLEVQNGVILGVGTTAFCESEAFKNQLVDGSGWIITDGGRCSSDILSMTFEGELSLATVDKVNHTVSVKVSDAATITSLPLTLTLSPRATSIPANGTIIDFSGTVNVLVTAGDGTTQQWSIVTTAVKPFITTWNVAQGNADVDAVTLNMTTGLTYNFNYIWKDVSGVAIPKDPGAIISAHIPSRLFISEFPSAGVYTLEIIGAFPHLSMDQDNIDQLIDVQQWGSIEWKSMKSSFKNWPVTGFTATDAPDLTNVTNMSFMFAESAFNQDLSAWNVSQISTMEAMFDGGVLSGQNYDKMLLAWSELPVKNLVKLGVGSTTFCLGEAARGILTATGWTITDGGLNCSSDTDILSMGFEGELAHATIDAVNHTVSIEVSNTATITSLPLTLTLSPSASSNLANGTLIDFTNEVSILVTAADGTTTQEWSIVTTVVKPFITTWTIDSTDLSHSLTMTDGFAYDFSYVWKDAANAVVFSGTHTSAAGAFSTTFQAAGTYTLEIVGSFPHFKANFTNIQKLADVNQWGDIAWQSMNSSFHNWPGSAFTATDAPNLANVTDMSIMFFNSSFNQDISIWDVGNVTNMSSMFEDSAFNQDISLWDVSNVEDMSFMFFNSSFNQDISIWDVGNVTNMSSMFEDSAFNQDISLWDVSNVEDMSFMFYVSPFNKDIGIWNVEKVTNMSSLFEGSPFNQDISLWDVSKVTDMNFMFTGSPFNQDLSGWNVSKVTDMSFMFDSSAFNQDISGWNVSNVKDMDGMFTDSQLSSQNYDKTLIGWAGLTGLQSGVELGAGSITYCLGEEARNILTAAPLNWIITDGGKNCSSATDILSMEIEGELAHATIDAVNHTVSIEVANTATITSLPLTLTLSPGAKSNPANGDLIDFTNEVSITVTAEDGTTTQEWSIVTTVVKPFITTWTIDSSDLSHSLTMTDGFDYDFSYVWKDAANAVVFSGTHTNAAGAFSTTFTTAVTYTLEIIGTFPHFNMGTFNSPTRVKLADVKQWGDIAWQSMASSFSNWPGSAFTATDAPNLTSVTDMSFMFAESAFNQNINDWNVSNVENMEGMFAESAFNQNIGDWVVDNVTDMSSMFYFSPFNQDIGGWNVSNVKNMSFMFEESPFNQDIGGWNVSKVTDMTKMFRFSAFNQDLSGWDVSAIENTGTFSSGMKDMFTESQLSSQNYDKTLIGWAGLPTLQGGVELGAGSITFCLGEEARNILTNTFNWIITDGGKNCSSATDILSFTFEAQTAEAIIDAVNHTVSIEVANTATITSLPLTLTLSSGASSNLANGTLIDFTNEVSILVTAADGTTTQEWTIFVTQEEPALGIPEQEQLQVSVYPNPFEEVVYIKAAKPFSISLNDMNGAHLRQANSEGELQLNLAGLSSGMYLLVIENEDGVTTKKLVKK